MTEGWVIMNANMDQYRAWQDGGTVWVKDLADATFYARRVDAEAVHLDDDAAWHVVLRPLPDGGEAVHTGQLRDEPVSSSGSGRDEAALPEAVWPGTCDGVEQEAFEAWAKTRRFDMTEHPLHYLFMDPKTDAARDAWKAGLTHAVERMKAAPPPPPVAELPGDVERLVKAAREAYRSVDPKDISDLPLVNELGSAVAAFDGSVPWERPASRAPSETGEGR